MTSPLVRQMPRVMPLAQVARELLSLDVHETYKLAREGKLAGAFKIGKNWFVSVPIMIKAMHAEASRDLEAPEP